MASTSVLPPDPATPPAAAAAVARPGDLFPGPAEPVAIHLAAPRPALARVAAIIPCHNRPADAAALLSDLSSLDSAGIDLRIILVDNASTIPLSDLAAPGLAIDHLRLNTNTGGSGGYSAGLSLALSLTDRATEPAWLAFNPDYVWLIDSDARVEPDTLRTLLNTLRQDPHAIAAAPAICDPITKQPFELGGRINGRTGIFEPHIPGAAGVADTGFEISDVRCEISEGLHSQSHISILNSQISNPHYLASCCALVRSDAARAAGPFPDTFLNADDVEWFIRMTQLTGGRLIATPACRAYHPRFDRFPTWTRYYTTRNASAPLAALRAPRRTRFRRAMLDAARAVQQHLSGRPDLARLHLLGLKHAAQGRTTGPAPAGAINPLPTIATTHLLAALRDRLGSLSGLRVALHPDLDIPSADRDTLLASLRAADCELLPLPLPSGPVRTLAALAARILAPVRFDIALVPARAQPAAWLAARTLVHCAPNQCWISSPSPIASTLRAAAALPTGISRAARIALRPARGPSTFNPAIPAAVALARGPGRALSVEAIVLSYNRWPALESTIESLLASPAFDGRAANPGVSRTITIVDNASTDGTPDRAETFLSPRGVNLIRLASNSGVEAFNTAVARSTADAVLILDDDATPDDNSLLLAIDRLAENALFGAVTLNPIHPRTHQSEWPAFRSSSHPTSHIQHPTSNAWPLMGCANLVRRTDWLRVGGYESAFFLYRNDADLALKLLAANRAVHFDPALFAHHDSPTGPGSPKSLRWHQLATRNWIWMSKRHSGMGLRGMGLPAHVPFRGMGILPMCLGSLLGHLWAHKLAGLSLPRHLATLRGALQGWRTPAPSLGSLTPTGAPFRSLLRLRLTRRL